MSDQKSQVFVYIDQANLHQGAIARGWSLDYKKFYWWLKLKFKASKIVLFMGFIQKNRSFYEELEAIGFILSFKKTYKTKENKIKGNCDAELILQATIDFYEKNFSTGILVSGDGDFSCLIDFWESKKIKTVICAPNKRFCSVFLKRKNTSLIFLENIKTKLQK